MAILALDIGGTAIKSALFEAGALVAQGETPCDGRRGGGAVLETALGIVAGYGAFERLGISTAGQVRPEDGSILFANDNIPGYTGAPVRAIFQEATGAPVAVLNDVNAAALGEAAYGAGRGYPDFVCLTLGTGVGGGLVLGGKLYLGADGIAGELGHMVTHPGGLPCVCGQRGCYEQYASAGALVRKAAALRPEIADGRMLFAALEAGDTGLSAVVSHWVDEVVLGLASLTHTLNPGAFVLGGGIMEQPMLLPLVRERFMPAIMPSYRRVQVLRAQLGNQAGLYGAMVAAGEL